MECYQHPKESAIGLCKSCFKAICRDCAVEATNGMACSENCANEVDEINALYERSKKVYGIGKYKSKIPSTGVIIWTVFSTFAWLAFFIPFFHKDKFNSSTLTVAIVFTLVLALTYYSSKRSGIQC